MKKKIVAMLLVGAMALSITACGGDAEPSRDAETTTEATTEQKEEPKEEAQPVDDGIIDFTAEKFNVKYVRHEFANDYEGNKCLLYYYTFTTINEQI